MRAEGTVVYLSTCAVSREGAPDPFMLQELPWLLSRFERVLMVSYYGVTELTGSSAEDWKCIPVKGSSFAAWRAGLRASFVTEFWRELFHLSRQGKLSLPNAVKLLLFTARGLKMHFWLEELLRSCQPSKTILYSYWMSFDAYAAALSKGKHPQLRLLVRGHAFDIDVQRNPMNPYLMKELIAKRADGLFLISRYAMEAYLRYMHGKVAPEKLRIAGVGSRGDAAGKRQEPPFFQAGELRVVSCSSIVEIKQLPALVDALAAWEGERLTWLHMGGGVQEEKLRAYAAKRLAGKENLTYEITGRIDNEAVQEIYAARAFDAFVNTSRMEGIPVSIMEAMRHGIPIIAPRVGGIPELVDDSVGILYDAGEGAQGVLKALKAFAALSHEQVTAMRIAAGARWEAKCRNEAILPLIFGEAEPKEGGVNSNG